MFEESKKIISEISKFIFTETNNNALRMSAAAGIDLITIGINIAAPAIIERHFSQPSQTKNDDHYELYIAGAVLLFAQVLPKFRNMTLNTVRANVQKELTKAMIEKVYELELDHQLTERTGEFAQALSSQ